MLAGSVVACGSTSKSTSTPSPAERAAKAAAEPRFASRGPYGVGVTTLHLADGRSVEVYYPADHADVDGKPIERYNETEPVPAAIIAAYPVPAGVDLTVEIPAVRDVAASAKGPFPLVLFSHGSGGWRDVYGNLLSGIASWGFVIASTDFTEYGLLAGFSGTLAAGEAKATAIVGTLHATLDLMTAQNGAVGGRFVHRIDPVRIAAAGHSTGGRTMFRLLGDSHIRTIIGWAPDGPAAPVTSSTPTLIIGGDGDAAITPAEVTATYGELRPSKRVVSIANMGHNAFTDTCPSIRNGTDLIGIAKSMKVPIPDDVLELGRNGCAPSNLDPALGWKVIQHFTVAQLRATFAMDPEPVGLGDAVTTAFDGVTMTMRHDP